jgi:hypothetical protein
MATCPLVRRYNLLERGVDELKSNAMPCDECHPSTDVPMIFPEKDRTWAQVSEDPEAVLEALYKYDQGGARYLTNVAQRLLEQASNVDDNIERVYRIEMIP